MSGNNFDIDQLTHLFHSIRITSHNSNDNGMESECDESFDRGFDSGYDSGYEAGYNKALEDIKNSNTSKNYQYHVPFGWQMVNGQMIQNLEEQITIEAIRVILRNSPVISLHNLCSELRRRKFNIRNFRGMNYSNAIRDIINDNKLR
jgi:hypothetical protein